MGKPNKTIEVRIHFFTDSLAPKGEVIPKHGLTVGSVALTANPRHGIKSGEPVMFNAMEQIPVALAKALDAAGITLRPPGKLAA